MSLKQVGPHSFSQWRAELDGGHRNRLRMIYHLSCSSHIQISASFMPITLYWIQISHHVVTELFTLCCSFAATFCSCYYQVRPLWRPEPVQQKLIWKPFTDASAGWNSRPCSQRAGPRQQEKAALILNALIRRQGMGEQRGRIRGLESGAENVNRSINQMKRNQM